MVYIGCCMVARAGIWVSIEYSCAILVITGINIAQNTFKIEHMTILFSHSHISTNPLNAHLINAVNGQFRRSILPDTSSPLLNDLS